MILLRLGVFFSKVGTLQVSQKVDSRLRGDDKNTIYARNNKND